MSIEGFFDHECDIYHLRNMDGSPGFALPSSPVFSYPDKPDEESVKCHFAVKAATVTVTQTEPADMMDAKIKLTLPKGTDIRLNDKIVWKETGLEYTAEQPRNIRNHHLFAYIKKRSEQRPIG